MRRYDIVSGILLILSIIDFALAAPVLVQEKRQACVDVVHIPKDVITVLEKRGDAEELEKLMEKYFKNMGNPVESSDVHASSSSAPPRPDHGPTDVVQAPGPNPTSSTTNPDRLKELSGPSSKEATQGESDDELDGLLHSLAYGSDHELTGAHAPQPIPNKRPLTEPDPDPDFDWNYWMKEVNPEDPRPPVPVPKRPKLSEEYIKPPIPESSDVHASTSSALPGPDRTQHGSTNVFQALGLNPESSTANPDRLMGPPGASSTAPKQGNDESGGILHAPVTKSGPDHELTEALAAQPNPNKRPLTGPDPDFNWVYWMKTVNSEGRRPQGPVLLPLKKRPKYEYQVKPDPDQEWISLDDLTPSPPRLASPKELGQAHHEHHVQQPDAGPSTEPGVVAPASSNPESPHLESPKEPFKEEIPGPSQTPDPEVLLNPSTSSADLPRVGYRPVDLQAAIYAAKGKEKLLRRISGITRDVGMWSRRSCSLLRGRLIREMRNPENL